MNETLVLVGENIARNAGREYHPFFGRDLLFGFVPWPMIWNVATTLLVVLIFWWLVKSSKTGEKPLELLKKRYVSGEIDKKTFMDMKRDISE